LSDRNRLIAACSPDLVAVLEPHLHEVLLMVGNVLHRPGEMIDQVYFPQSGLVSLMAVLNDGTMIETVNIGNEGAIGSIEGFGTLRAFSFALVQVPGMALRMSGDIFRRIVSDNDELKELINHYHMSVMASTQQTLACNSFHDIRSRLSRSLLLVGERCGNDIRLTQEALAVMLGVQRTSLTRAIRALRETGAVYYRRNVISIRDSDALRQTACECYGTIRRAMQDGFRSARPPPKATDH
jgi:CRP-like cAMP-binding protein